MIFKKILPLLFSITQIYSQNCNIDNGFTWCESSKKCVRELYEPCLPITKECAYCILSNYGDDTTCGEGCSIDIIESMTNNGFLGTDENGCASNLNTIWCESIDRCINKENEICPTNNDHCNNIICSTICPLGYYINQKGCTTCSCNEGILDNSICPLPIQECNNDIVCPKITEITHCSNGGINGYTTYQLSLIINKENGIKNIYALFGDSSDIPIDGSSMIIPPAYQSPSSIFNSNFGGINPQLLSLDILSEYDSWLTIGITDGDPNNLLSSIGIDFNTWTSNTGLEVTNGAIFLLDPRASIVQGNEYVIARLTIPTDDHAIANFNVQGEGELQSHEDTIWMQRNIQFHLHKLLKQGH